MPADLSWTDIVLSLVVGISLAAAVGLRVFLPLLVLGTAGRLDWITLDADFAWLSSNLGLGTLATAAIVEIAAYYIPTLDNAFDLLAGPAALGAGVLALAAVTGDLPAPIRWSVAVIAGGGTAGIVQGLTTIARLKSTGLTGGLANPIIATFELLGSATVALLAVLAPFVALGIVVALVLAVRRRRRGLAPTRDPSVRAR